MPVRSVLVLLRKEANSPELTGAYEEGFAGEEPSDVYRYHALRLWQVPAEALLTGGLGLVPLATLTDDAEPALPDVTWRMQERFAREASAEDAPSLTATSYLLMGLHTRPGSRPSSSEGKRWKNRRRIRSWSPGA